MTYTDLLGAGRLDYSHTQPFIIFEKVQIFYFVNEHNVFCWQGKVWADRQALLQFLVEALACANCNCAWLCVDL